MIKPARHELKYEKYRHSSAHMAKCAKLSATRLRCWLGGCFGKCARTARSETVRSRLKTTKASQPKTNVATRATERTPRHSGAARGRLGSQECIDRPAKKYAWNNIRNL